MDPFTLAKTISDKPDAHSLDQLHGAYEYLAKLRSNRVHGNSKRLNKQLECRIEAVKTEIENRT